MKNNFSILSEFKPALRFVLIFVGVYVTGNVVYGLFVEAYKPWPDPATRSATIQCVSLINTFFDSAEIVVSGVGPYVFITKDSKLILTVFEGCNGLNTMIVFASFVISFGGTFKNSALYIVMGVIIIHLANLLRLVLLFWTAIHQPSLFYYFHKYFFTAVLYAVVFILWYGWIEWLKRKSKRTDVAKA